MLLINKLSSSSSMFNLSNTKKRKRTSTGMTSKAPLLHRLKKSFIHHTSTEYESKPVSTGQRSNTLHCCLSEKEEIPSTKDSSDPTLFKTDNTKCYPLRLENSNINHKYPQAIENWWSTTPPIHHQQQNHHQYSKYAVMAC